MILAIDIGNTNIVLGCIQENKILFTERLSTDHAKTDLEHAISIKIVLELHNINPREVTGAIIGSVVPPITALIRDALYKITGCPAIVVGPGVKTGLNILMDNPAQVGSDLIVGAVAGIAEYPLPLILIDMGTATTICVIDENKNYIGGMILPGLRVSLDSLTSRTSQLPKISLEPPKRLIGKNTIECMKSGILYGNASCIDGMISRIEEDLGQSATAVATGGLAAAIVPLCRHNIILDDELLLKGLLLIYKKNI
ncbi:MAG: type III pantothenate kinase [Lachnospiraceae bacterium]|nr:type III pantothenate kinase [Lachnospiraceae bacterium]